MATWTTIPDSSLEPGKPIRSIDALALRDNPSAIAEGASGAPRILDAALGSTATAGGATWVLARTAAAAVGAVGTYAFMRQLSGATTNPGGTATGSSLRFAGVGKDDNNFTIIPTSTMPSGTWLCLGYSQSPNFYQTATLWLRIS